MVRGESRERRGNILRKVPVALWRMVCKCFVKSSLGSNRRARYFMVLDKSMVTFWSWRGWGFEGRRFVNNMSSVFETFTRSFHLLKYLSSWDRVELSLRVMVSSLRDWDRMAISSANKASWVSGGVGYQQYRGWSGWWIGLRLELVRLEGLWAWSGHRLCGRYRCILPSMIVGQRVDIRALLELWVCRVGQWSKRCHMPSLNRGVPFLCVYEGCSRGIMWSTILASWETVECFLRKPNWVSGIRWFWLTNVVSLEAMMRSRSLVIELRRLMGW